MAGFTAFYDANVLYPAELRNLLMHLALTGLFRAKWSADVHEEWICSLLQKRPDLTRDKLERTRMLMDKHAVDALVTGYEDLIPGLQLPDKQDRHVLAAAIRCHANVIVTMNLRDFPSDVLAPLGMEAQHPRRIRPSSPRLGARRSRLRRTTSSRESQEPSQDGHRVFGNAQAPGLDTDGLGSS